MLIHKYIVHVLDKNTQEPVINEFEGKVNKEVEDLICSYIKKGLRSKSLKKAKFKDDIYKSLYEGIIYDESIFVNNSKEIANQLFHVMKSKENISSCDLLICLFSIKQDKYIGVIKLDYKKSYNHIIEVVDEKLNVEIKSNEIVLPTSRQKISRCAFIGTSGKNDDYHLEVLDDDIKKIDNESYFTSQFLRSTIVVDDKEMTKLFKEETEKWVRNSCYDNIQTAILMRENLENVLKNNEDIDLHEFASKVIEDKNMSDSLITQLIMNGVKERFDIDKDWVSKNFKKKSIKTDTGFELKGNFDEFEDYFKHQIKKNNDGSIDLIIKNVKSFEIK